MTPEPHLTCVGAWKAMPVGALTVVDDYEADGTRIGTAHAKIVRPATFEEYIAYMAEQGRPVSEQFRENEVFRLCWYYWVLID